MNINLTNPLEKSVRYLKGIGPRRYESLKSMGVETIRDLCHLFPRRYEDRASIHLINQIKIGQTATIQGVIEAVTLKPLRHLRLLELWVRDESSLIPAIWFNQAYLKRQFIEGRKIILTGKVELYQNRVQMTSPEHELIDDDSEGTIHTGRIVPVYPLSEGLFQRSLRSVMYDLVAGRFYDSIRDHLPLALSKKYGFLPLEEALSEIHFPSNLQRLEQAKRRLIYDELLRLELKLLRIAKEIKLKQKSFPIPAPPDILEEFCKAIPFPLTGDQKRSIAEISADLKQIYPMHRLLQGEVGSGKTVVAAYMIKAAAVNQAQTAFLVPTEILAEQHFITLKRFLSPLSVNIELLTASTVGVVRRDILNRLANGKVDVLIGTHALLQEEVEFKKLGVLIIDEQHKFGVEQRAKLMNRDVKPHLLIMSATPIPRTLGLTFFGDLQISTLKELPKGRKEIETMLMRPDDSKKIAELIRQRVFLGEQVYILYPLIEESDKLEAQAATKEYEQLKNGELMGISIGLVHGKLSKLERDLIMEEFRNGSIKVLVATTVVEVGVDNPNATLMVIHNAERFGLSQLHQIRGRIGRGSKDSLCILSANTKTEESQKRLQILIQTNDGFEIAEEDLKLRGPGEFFGFKQSGVAYFRLADLAQDEKTLIQARADAMEILEKDPELNSYDNNRLKDWMS